jgi:hypothetical protein
MISPNFAARNEINDIAYFTMCGKEVEKLNIFEARGIFAVSPFSKAP